MTPPSAVDAGSVREWKNNEGAGACIAPLQVKIGGAMAGLGRSGIPGKGNIINQPSTTQIGGGQNHQLTVFRRGLA